MPDGRGRFGLLWASEVFRLAGAQSMEKAASRWENLRLEDEDANSRVQKIDD